MKLFMFRTAKPRRFAYKPRYYDEAREALEKRKAELGVESHLSDEEKLRLRMSSRWRRDQATGLPATRYTFIIYAIVALGGVYIIFFTDFIDNLLRSFGVGK
ncbi:MAG TPA: hypothetical protein PKE03_02045 [Bacteroidales bacterium]|nr:hypothetical protein [Bacteroidales bacterium]